jgi:thiol-disulfide isomerase/thioredoxin
MRGRESHRCFATCITLFVVTLALCVKGFGQDRSISDLSVEVNNYISTKTKSLLAEGKKVDAAKREDLAREKKSLAAKYAAEASARSDLKEKDLYYLGLLYLDAEDDIKLLEAMKRFLAQYPPETKGDMIQSARAYIAVYSAKRKLLDEAEKAYQLWLTGSPVEPATKPTLEQVLAVAFFKDGQYEKAIKYGRDAFDLLKTLKARTVSEKRTREEIYINLIEVLAMSYKKSKNADQALESLAEARAESFAIPSANLYRKVMDFVEGGGFSEKKLMQKVESYASAEPAPNLAIEEWIGREPVDLSQLRGKVVLLDFWATWCMPCISTFPRLRGWYKKYSGDDFVLVGVTWLEGQKDSKKMSKLQELDYLKEFKEKYKMSYPIAVLPTSTESSMKYGINAYPTTVLLDRKGVVRYIGIGAGPEESENLEDMIQKVLKEGGQIAENQSK